MNFNRLLEDYLSAIGNFINKMNGSAANLNTVCKRRLVNSESVEALAAEGRDQSRMYIDDAFRPLLGEVFAEDTHKARQNNQFNAIFLQRFGNRRFKCLLAATQRLLAANNALDACIL